MSAEWTPKDRFTALDTLAVARELRAAVGIRVDKVFDRAGGGWSVVLRGAAQGRQELALVPGRFAALTADRASHGEELSAFARELRRLLAGAALDMVVEPHGERMLEVVFRRSASGEVRVVLEIFGSGNLIVVAEGKVVAVATPRRWAHRSLRVGVEYAPPPAHGDPWSMSSEALARALGASRTNRASTLATRLGLGAALAEEALVRAGLSGNSPAAEEAEAAAGKTALALEALRRDVADPPLGFLYRVEGDAVDLTPFPSERFRAAGVEPALSPRFSDAAVAYFAEVLPAPPSREETEAHRARLEMERTVERQRTAIEAMGREAADLKGRAERVLAHYAESEAAVLRARGAPGPPTTTSVEIDGQSLELPVRQSPRETAGEWFEESKRIRQKIDGARLALAENERQLARPAPPAPASRARPAEATDPARRFWFERFRWFVSSEGTIVIAGKDAPSNDTMVRRHLKAGDIYLHADIHGAASVVAKRPEGAGSVGDATIQEAAQWAVAFSKAWRAGLATAEAFWVTPEQVSKEATSGEFVPRGAWVIHGEKHFLRDVPLELALGRVRYRNEERWVVAPERSVRAQGEVVALLTPGEERERPVAERTLAADLGVPRSLLQSLLPAGGFVVRRT